MSPLRVAVIGVGHLGKEHARILSGFSEVELIGVVDANLDQAQAVARRCGTLAYADCGRLLNSVDAAVVAVPTSAHHAVAVPLLTRGVSLLVEKPLAPTLAQAEELVELAQRHGAVLQVGHIERFNPGFEELARRAFQPKFIECERFGAFTGRSMDIGVVLDLMIHDLDLLLALVRSAVIAVDALGISVVGQHEDVAHARLRFANGCVANLSASRINPSAARRMRLWGPEGFASIDFAQRALTLIQPSGELRRNGLDIRPQGAGGLAALKNELDGRHLQTVQLDCNRGDQLTRELEDFVYCARTGSRPRVSGEDGRDTIALATRILDSLHSHSWTGTHQGPAGPLELPAPLGTLFEPPQQDLAA